MQYEVITKKVGEDTMYSTDRPKVKGQRLFPLGYFKTEKDAIKAREDYNKANDIV